MTLEIYMPNGQKLTDYVDSIINERVGTLAKDYQQLNAAFIELEEDLMYARDGLHDVIDWANDPNGFSRTALISVANRGLRK